MLQVVHLITDLDTGGAEIMLARLLEPSGANRVRHSVVSLTTVGTVGERIAGMGIPVYALGLRAVRPNPWTLVKLVRLLRSLRPDLLQTWLYHADLVGTIAGSIAAVPNIVWNIRCAELEPRDYRASLQVLLKILAWASRLPALVIYNSHAGRAVHERLGYTPRRWEVIPNGLDPEIFRPSAEARRALRGRLPVAEATSVVGILARYHPMKDHVTFLHAAAVVARERGDVHFVAAGRDIAGNAALLAAIDRLGLSGRVSLWPEQARPADFLAGCDVVVLSSASGEGFPNVVAEAMACGVPCVVTDVGDAARIVGNAGIVVPTRDPDALARGILRYLTLDAAERDAVSRGARERIVEHFSLGRVVRRYDGLYSEVVGRSIDGADSQVCAE